MSAITLSPMTREMCHTFYREFENDPAIFQDMSKFYEFEYTPAWADNYFDRQMARGRLLFAVMLEGRPIGEVKLWDLDMEKGECNLGIHLRNDSVKGKGYGTAAEKLALDYAFRVLGLKAVNADVVLKNTRSQHVLEKVGFRFVQADETYRYYRCENKDHCKKESPDKAMSMEIRMMTAGDEEAVLDMMRQFYSSPAVLSNGSEEIFRNDIAACLEGGPWIEGYVFEENGVRMGYAMVAKTFNCEYGKPCKWIEDLFILPAFRGRGIGGTFLDYIAAKYPESLLRLEAEEENEGAVSLYRRHGFDVLPYLQMKKNT